MTPTRRSTNTIVGLAAALCAGLAACSTAGATPSAGHHVLDVNASDYSYQMSGAPLDAGVVTIKLRNSGAQPHQANIARLHDDVTYDQFEAAVNQGVGPALALIDFEGGVNTIDPGATGVAYSKLTVGNYILLCFVQDADGVPHLAKGMVKPFRVARGARRVRPPHTEGTVELRSYGFDLPARFGHGAYAVVNKGDEPHELTLLRVAPGKTAGDVLNFLKATTPPAGPLPFADAGGVSEISPGVDAYGRFNLPPGDYVALCFVPDDQTHIPHFLMGMFQPFTVN
ncbi:MAG: hypothetical protein M3083_19370 [Actinomycetota bacterium]|nr:hypothetical protein [Actinomycetota bacterium]